MKKACAAFFASYRTIVSLTLLFLAWINKVFWLDNQLEPQNTETISKHHLSLGLWNRTVGPLT